MERAQKPAKAFAKFLRDLERDPCWSIFLHARIHFVKRRIGHRDDRGVPGVCNASMLGERRLAIVVAAEITSCVVNGSFYVKERSCAIDVCWEGKKFRVICSHLNLDSVMHIHARDLEDLCMRVSSRVKDAHVHMCVGAQTGLGTGISGADSSNIGPAITVTHRAEKQRPIECFIMEHLLTATNIFSNDDDRNANIYTFNYNDYILSSDHSLRSRTFDSSATSSDHWGLTATVREKRGIPPGKRHARKKPSDGTVATTLVSTTQCCVHSWTWAVDLLVRSRGSAIIFFFALYINTDGSPGCVAKTDMCWMELHSCDEASSTWGLADGGGLWTMRTSTSAPQEARITQRRCRESSKHFSG